MATLVLTLIGDDRAGLVNAVAEVVARHGGNWERSQMAELAGKFAGIVLVTVADDDVDGLVAALEPLHGMLEIHAQAGAMELEVIAPGARRFALDLVGTDLGVQGIAFESDVQPATLSVMADEAAMVSLLTNLMRNAIDAMQEAPRRVLGIQARANGDRVNLAVTDTGPGIRADILPRLFEPFVTSKPAGAGLGLGLVISAQLVQAAGGTLRAGNRDEGGACFTVDLPMAVSMASAKE